MYPHMEEPIPSPENFRLGRSSVSIPVKWRPKSKTKDINKRKHS